MAPSMLPPPRPRRGCFDSSGVQLLSLSMGAFMPPADSVIVRMVARRPAQFPWKQIPYSTDVNAIFFGNTLHFLA
jgi:hypothetical protein